MRSNLWRAAYLLLNCGLLGTAWADSSRPPWVDHPPKEDSSKYYIGRASELPNEEAAFRQATVNGREQAIGSNFGILTQIRSETYQSTETAQSTQTSEELSRRVSLVDFEQSDAYQENHDGKISVWILFKYNKAAIAREKSRLSALKEEGNESFNLIEQGDDRQALKNGTLEVISKPAGAPVRIDGNAKLGDLDLRTPLLLKGLFSPVKHTVEIDDPRYELVSQQVTLSPGTTARVDKVLKRAYGTLSVRTEPPGATVFLGAKLIGTSPIETDVRIMAEVPVDLEIRHPQTETYRTEIRLGKGESWHTPITLKWKPSTLAVSSTPSGALVEIDSNPSKSTPTGQIAVLPGEHRVRVSKEGYHSYETTLTLLGGEHRVLAIPSLSGVRGGLLKGLSHLKNYSVTLDGNSLRSFSKRSPASASSDNEIAIKPGSYNLRVERDGYETYVASIEIPEGGEKDISGVSLAEIPSNIQRLTNPPWSISAEAIGSTKLVEAPSVPLLLFGLSGRYQLMKWVGVEVAALGGAVTTTYSNGTLADTIIAFRSGLPITVIRPAWYGNDSIALIPEIVFASSAYSVNMTASSATGSQSTTQLGYGGSILYRTLTPPKEDVKGVWGLGFRVGVHHYQSPPDLVGQNAISGGLQCTLGF